VEFQVLRLFMLPPKDEFIFGSLTAIRVGNEENGLEKHAMIFNPDAARKSILIRAHGIPQRG